MSTASDEARADTTESPTPPPAPAPEPPAGARSGPPSAPGPPRARTGAEGAGAVGLRAHTADSPARRAADSAPGATARRPASPNLLTPPGPELFRHAGWPALLWRAGPGWRMLSSAVLGGGLGERAWVLNAQVPPGYARMDPVAHLEEIAAPRGLTGPGVGLMTAADVEAYTTATDHGVRAWVTTGIGIPTWAAAPDEGSIAPPRPGTINIVAAVPAPLSDAALANALATATEAKVQALFETGYACTGTPSDAVCVAARTPRHGEEPVLFGGPRSPWGARLARAVHAAVVRGALDDRIRRTAHGISP